MSFAHSSCRIVLNAMLRVCTLARRVLSAADVEVGLASIDWQMLPRPQIVRAAMLPLRTFHRLKMFGIEETLMRASGRPVLSTLSPAASWVRKFAVLVIVASELVQTSLAP